MAIKKLQNNYTTPEQSKRLLELGVHAGSADLFYFDHGVGFTCLPTLVDDTEYVCFFDERFLPCWSVGRLIDIIIICSTAPFPNEIIITRRNVDLSIVETLIDRLNELANYYSLDFSKLEG